MTRNAQLFKGSKVTFATILFTALLMLADATSVFAGGFQLAVEAPDASKTSLKDAALIVRTFGCFQPADANVTVTAEGVVNGRRQSLPVELRSVVTSACWKSTGDASATLGVARIVCSSASRSIVGEPIE